MEALNSVIREGKFLLMNTEIMDMEEERRWFKRGTKAGMRYLVAGVDGKVAGGASIHLHSEKRAHVAEYGIFIREGRSVHAFSLNLHESSSQLCI